jgi:hypothetical protein
VDVPPLPGSHPRRLAAISHQPPTLLTAVSWLFCYQSQSQSQSYVTTDGQSASLFLCQVPSGPKTRFLLLSGSSGFVGVGRENESVVYNCCWPSPPQSFSCPSPAGLMTIFYCLRFKIPPTWRTRLPYLYPTGTGWPSYTARYSLPFSSPLTTRRATVEVFEPASTRKLSRKSRSKSPVVRDCLLRRSPDAYWAIA